MKGDRKFAPLFSVVSVDAWAEGEGGWTWNESRRLFSFRSNSSDMRRTFVARLRHYLRTKLRSAAGNLRPVELGRGWFTVTDDWYVMELYSKKDGCPAYACIRETEGAR